MYYVFRYGVIMLAYIIFKSLAIQSLSENNHFSNTGAKGPWRRGEKKNSNYEIIFIFNFTIC